MIRIELDELQTLIVGMVALFVGRFVRQSIPALRKIDMPNAVVGAMIVALLVLLAQLYMGYDVASGRGCATRCCWSSSPRSACPPS